MNTTNIRPLFCIFLLPLAMSCKKLIQVNAPTTSLDGTTVFNSDASAASAVTFVYENMMGTASFSGGQSGLSLLCGLQADELVNYIPGNTTLVQFYTNSLNSSNIYFWDELYEYIYVANSAIQGLAGPTSVSPAVSQQLTGEARFIRAFMLYYLTTLYGDVPLPTTTNYQTNNTLSRSPQAQVIQQVVADLQLAQGLLSENYLTAANASTNERVRPNKVAATALLARAYLFTGDYKDAETQATAVIGDANYSLVPSPDSVFLANSTEAIWQLSPVTPEFNTNDGFSFILTSGPNYQNSVGLSPFLQDAFEPGDVRMQQWVGVDSSTGTNYYFPYKYKVGYGQPLTEYQMVMRLAEQYLIRAEARAQQGNITGPGGALADLDAIRSRAGLGAYAGATDKTSVLTAILHERQVELFTEWGQRWLDLKRTGNIDAVMNAVEPSKGGSWKSDWQLDPVPRSDISINPHLIQNPGY